MPKIIQYKIIFRLLSLMLLFSIYSKNTIAQNFFLNAGFSATDLQLDTGIPAIDNNSSVESGYHLGFAIRNSYGLNINHHFGFGIDIDKINGDTLLALRALDYQYNLTPNWRTGVFLGAIKLESGAAQNGFYLGFNIMRDQWRKNLDLGFELRHGSGLARDRLPSERLNVTNNRPDVFLDYVSAVFFLSWRL